MASRCQLDQMSKTFNKTSIKILLIFVYLFRTNAVDVAASTLDKLAQTPDDENINDPVVPLENGSA